MNERGCVWLVFWLMICMLSVSFWLKCLQWLGFLR